mmetsp:Transcript_20049/g.35307  ORF Transcript_20049/g.35307 Transcript_20049/m.35307 type:complete len:136 (+) Transcript_20049:361-768(+)
MVAELANKVDVNFEYYECDNHSCNASSAVAAGGCRAALQYHHLLAHFVGPFRCRAKKSSNLKQSQMQQYQLKQGHRQQRQEKDLNTTESIQQKRRLRTRSCCSWSWWLVDFLFLVLDSQQQKRSTLQVHSTVHYR